MSSSSGDSEDDEEKKKLAQALDPDFLTNQISTANGNGHPMSRDTKSNMKKGIKSCDDGTNKIPPSKRAKVFSDAPDPSHFTQLYSLDVTPDSQKFIAKQLSKALESNLKEVSPPHQPAHDSPNDPTAGIRLFATSKIKVTESDLNITGASPKKKQKSKSKKHKKGKNEESSSSESETEKLKSVAVSADWVLRQD